MDWDTTLGTTYNDLEDSDMEAEHRNEQDEGDGDGSDDEGPDIHLEPMRTQLAEVEPDTADDTAEDPQDSIPQRGIYHVSEQLYNTPVVYKYGGLAGKVYGTEEIKGEKTYQHTIGDSGNIYAPFSSQLDWEVGKWAKLRGPSSTAFTDLMRIEGVSDDFVVFW